MLYVPGAGEVKAARFRKLFGVPSPYGSSRTCTALWPPPKFAGAGGVPFSALSTPVVTLERLPLCQRTSGETCQSPSRVPMTPPKRGCRPDDREVDHVPAIGRAIRVVQVRIVRIDDRRSGDLRRGRIAHALGQGPVREHAELVLQPPLDLQEQGVVVAPARCRRAGRWSRRTAPDRGSAGSGRAAGWCCRWSHPARRRRGSARALSRDESSDCPGRLPRAATRRSPAARRGSIAEATWARVSSGVLT